MYEVRSCLGRAHEKRTKCWASVGNDIFCRDTKVDSATSMGRSRLKIGLQVGVVW